MNIFICGNNETKLIRNNHKRTYSLPQTIPSLPTSILQMTASHDFVLFLTKQTLFCYYQSALHFIKNIPPLKHIATLQNTIFALSVKGEFFICEFQSDKLLKNQLVFKLFKVPQPILWFNANYNNIFLYSQKTIHHFNKNKWHEQFKFSTPTAVYNPQRIKFKQICPGLSCNWFLSQDHTLYYSSKVEPCRLKQYSCALKFKRIAASHYQVAIGLDGQLYIWGDSIHVFSNTPIPFGEISTPLQNIYLGSNSGFALTQKRELWAWGKNGFGELGTSDYQPRLTPYPVIFFAQAQLKRICVADGFTVCELQDLHSNKAVYFKQNPSYKKARSKTPTSRRQNIQSITPPNSNKNQSCIETRQSQCLQNKITSFKSEELIKQKDKENSFLRAKIQELESNNKQLKDMVIERDETIEDITHKIKLLQEAIGDYERAISLRSIEQPSQESSPKRDFSQKKQNNTLRNRDQNIVQNIISKIQESKEGISRSARKLKELLAQQC